MISFSRLSCRALHSRACRNRCPGKMSAVSTRGCFSPLRTACAQVLRHTTRIEEPDIIGLADNGMLGLSVQRHFACSRGCCRRFRGGTIFGGSLAEALRRATVPCDSSRLRKLLGALSVHARHRAFLQSPTSFRTMAGLTFRGEYFGSSLPNQRKCVQLLGSD